MDGGDSAEGLGRYINDSPKKYANVYPKNVDMRIHFYSKKRIPKGEELRYSYDMIECTWRKMVRIYEF